MRRALVTGAGGFVGANLARRLLGDGWEVELLVHAGSDRWRLDAIGGDARVHEADVTNAAAVESIVARSRPTHVFHLAAHGAYSWQADDERILGTNVLGTLHVLEAALRHGCEAVVNTGSSSEYGFVDHAPAEDELPVPNSVYAVGKAAATLLAGHLGRGARTRISTLRLYSVYGPFEEPGRLLPALALAALEDRLPPLAGPETARDFVHVDDVVDAYLSAAERAGGGAVYNVGSGTQTTLAELVAVVGEVFSFTPKPEWGSLPARAWDTSTWVANAARIRAELGWEPRRTLPEGVRALADWLASSLELRERYETAARMNRAASSGRRRRATP
jgi:nucleoside-diphosphate-sugar epimerase